MACVRSGVRISLGPPMADEKTVESLISGPLTLRRVTAEDIDYSQLRQLDGVDIEFVEVYKRNLTPEVQIASGFSKNDIGDKTFSTEVTLHTENGDAIELASFSFHWDDDYIDLAHRETVTKRFGLSGRELLGHALTIIGNLPDDSEFSKLPIYLATPDFEVATWSSKVGFTFKDESVQDIFESSVRYDESTSDDVWVIVTAVDTVNSLHPRSCIVKKSDLSPQKNYTYSELRGLPSNITFELIRDLD